MREAFCCFIYPIQAQNTLFKYKNILFKHKMPYSNIKIPIHTQKYPTAKPQSDILNAKQLSIIYFFHFLLNLNNSVGY